MKKLALLASAAAISTAAMADSSACATTGFYAGANLGLANTQVKYNLTNGVTGAAKLNQASDMGKMGLQYGLMGGYNMGLGNGAVVGVELFVGGDSSKVKADDNGSGNSAALGKVQVKRRMYYGLAPRVGYMVTPNTLAYVRLGLEGGQWKADYIPANNDTLFTTAESKKVVGQKKNRINFAPGVGMDVFVSKNMFVRAQYHYVFGPKLTVKSSDDSDDTALPYKTERKFKTSQHVFSLAVGYKF